nr:DUF1353 domain-containing protein [Propionivibrio sp.]
MSRFLTPLVVTLLDDAANEGRGEWRLFEPLPMYQTRSASSLSRRDSRRISPAFRARPSCSGWPPIPHQAAVIHDYLYATASVSRADADDVLLEAMEDEGVPAWRRWGMYLAVRAFGGSHYGYAAD